MQRTDITNQQPRELIAQEPRPRGGSRMMVITPGDGPPSIAHRTFADFPRLIEPGDVLVINDTRVIPARLFARPKGRMKNRLEFLLVRQRSASLWETWCRPAKRVRPGDVVSFSDRLTAAVVEKMDDGRVLIEFRGDLEEIERIGIPPLPPYIERETPRESDREAYQTVYAAERGAIAAPTAGLHFTPEILDAVRARGADIPATAQALLLFEADGRSETSAGLDLYDLAAYLIELGAVEAMNLDGGGSTTLTVNGALANSPSGGRSR